MWFRLMYSHTTLVARGHKRFARVQPERHQFFGFGFSTQLGGQSFDNSFSGLTRFSHQFTIFKLFDSLVM
jgi:hypothetical protein